MQFGSPAHVYAPQTMTPRFIFVSSTANPRRFRDNRIVTIDVEFHNNPDRMSYNVAVKDVTTGEKWLAWSDELIPVEE